MRAATTLTLFAIGITLSSCVPFTSQAQALRPRTYNVQWKWLTTTVTKHSDGRPDTIVKTISTTPPATTAPITTTTTTLLHAEKPVESAPTAAMTPAASQTPAPPVTASLDAWSLSMLTAHNLYRSMHGAPALTWNPVLVDYASANVAKCVFEHTHGQYGENIASGFPDGVSVVKAWYDEHSLYNFSKPGYESDTGHFSQAVWVSTHTLGCSQKDCVDIGTFVQCNYDPPGNIVGDASYFEKNVLPLLPNMQDD